ncbi:MAG: tetratricopeptide repeat protein [Planctomycetota bacterium]
MLRVFGFFLLALLLASVLRHVPLIGPLFSNTGVFGIFLAAALLSFLFARYGERMLTARKLKNEIRALGAVESAHNQGKLGSLLLARGRARQALAPLERAAAGEPELAEWHYRLGLARLELGDASGALGAFEACVAREEEHAYGSAMLRRAECLQRLGRAADALRVLELHERNHGEGPEASFRRGRALASLKRRPEARAAFDRAIDLAARATRYQKAAATGWAVRARLARMF